MTLFPLARPCHNPLVIVPDKPGPGDAPRFCKRELEGAHWHVMPQTDREVFWLKSIEHRVDKFAPYVGGGVILTNRAYQGLRRKEEE